MGLTSQEYYPLISILILIPRIVLFQTSFYNLQSWKSTCYLSSTIPLCLSLNTFFRKKKKSNKLLVASAKVWATQQPPQSRVDNPPVKQDFMIRNTDAAGSIGTARCNSFVFAVHLTYLLYTFADIWAKDQKMKYTLINATAEKATLLVSDDPHFW